MPENLPSSVWAVAWCELYRLFGEQLNQDALDAMDAVWSGVVADMQDEMKRGVERTPDAALEAGHALRQRLRMVLGHLMAAEALSEGDEKVHVQMAKTAVCRVLRALEPPLGEEKDG